MEYDVVVSSDWLYSLSGAALSLALAYFPFGFSEWYAGLSGLYKRLVLLGCALLVCALAFAGACSGVVSSEALTCGRGGVLVLLDAFVGMAIASQAMYTFLPEKSEPFNFQGYSQVIHDGDEDKWSRVSYMSDEDLKAECGVSE